MTNYLTEIDRLVRAEVERETAELRGELVRAQWEAETARQMQSESWREARVAERIAEYRERWAVAQSKLDDVIDAVSHEGDSAWSIVELVREIVQ
jgi:hypothetical protein